MPNPARTSEVSPAPTHTGFDLNASGVITSPAWLAWFQRIAFPAMKLTLEMRDAAVFEPVTGRDIQPDIDESVQQQQRTDAYRYDLVEEQQQLQAAAETRRDQPEIDDLQQGLAAVNAPRDWRALIDDLQLQVAFADGSNSGSSTTAVIVDTHAHRAGYNATAYPDALYWETDRTVLYLSVVTAGVGAWTYVGGSMSGALASIPNDLGATDVNFRFGSTDYLHEHRWDGAVWHFSPGDPGSAWCIATSGAAPQGGLWASCDGSSPLCALDNGTSGTVATPDTRAVAGNSPFIMGGGGGAQQAATAPTVGVIAPLTVVGAAADSSINKPTETSGGLPLRVSLAWYMRR